MTKKVNLRILTPNKVLYDNQVIMASVPSESGYIGFMYGHVQSCVVLKSGEIRVYEDNIENVSCVFNATGNEIANMDGKVCTVLFKK